MKDPNKPVWVRFPVTLKCFNLRGGEPKAPAIVDEHSAKRSHEMIMRFLEMKKKGVRGQADSERVAEMMGTTIADLETMTDKALLDWPKSQEQVAESMAVGFLSDPTRDGQLYIRAGSVRAHFKDNADSLREFMEKKWEMKQFGVKLRRSLYIAGAKSRDKVYVERPDGSPVTEPDESLERTMRVVTARGERSCLKVVDQVNDVHLQFVIVLKNDGIIEWGHLADVLTYGEQHGINQDRSLQYGQYTFELGEAEDEMR
jgi:hypothetical protein